MFTCMNMEMGESSIEFDLTLVVTMEGGGNRIRILSCGRVGC